MTHESLSNAEWLRTVNRLGGAELLESEARELGAFKRARKVICALDQLRLALAYCWSGYGLRLAAAWAGAVGLVSLSNVALLKRLRNSADWLERLVGRLVATPCAPRNTRFRPSVIFIDCDGASRLLLSTSRALW